MKTLILLILIVFPPGIFARDYLELAMAVQLVESNGNLKAYNSKEKAVGPFQIRPIRVKDYNQRLGTNYKLKDFFSYELSLQMFLYYANGKSYEIAARSWNGSGPKTVTYWKKVKTKLNYLMNIRPETKDAYKLLHEGILALARAERQGLRIDVDSLLKYKIQMQDNIANLEKDFLKSKFFKEWQNSTTKIVNPNSLPQLGEFLYNVKGIKPYKLTTTGKGSTDEDALKQLNMPELAFYTDRKRWKKALDVLSGFERETTNGFMHPNFNLHTVRTFRSSSSNPNFQNIPARDKEISKICRSVIFPRKGHMLMESDFKSIEVGISSCVNKDPKLLEYVCDPSTDMHRDMCQQIFLIDKFDKAIPSHDKLRKASKNGFVFPQFYGDYYKNNAVSLACEWGGLPQGKWGTHQGMDMVGWNPPLEKYHLSDHLKTKGIKSFNQFVEHMKSIEDDFWNNRFPIYKQWKDTTYQQYLKTGYVDMYTGFRCWGPMSKNDVCNYPVQGPAFHCLLKSFIKVDKIFRKEKLDSKLVGQIHDSMVLDVNPDELEYVTKIVKWVTSEWLPEQFPWIIVPISVEIDLADVDRPWSEKESMFKFIFKNLTDNKKINCKFESFMDYVNNKQLNEASVFDLYDKSFIKI